MTALLPCQEEEENQEAKAFNLPVKQNYSWQVSG